ncbi:MAG: flagellar biosynthetic protein FliO [Azonexus sp.]
MCLMAVGRKRQTPLGRGRASRLTLLALAASVGPAAAGAGAAGQAITGVEVVGQVTLSLMLVVAVLLVLAWAMRRLGRFQSQTASNLQVLGGLRLGARERILLVEAEGRRLLVGVAPGGLRTLLVFDEGTGREATAPAATSFSVKEFP